jgi:hypothetical protein
MRRIGWRTWLPAHTWRVVKQVEAADEVPSKIPRWGAVLVGSWVQPKWLAFDCPCRRTHRLMLALDPRNSPHWTLAGRENGCAMTLWPSVDCRRPDGGRCHFIMRTGSVYWIRERSWFDGWA